MRRAALGLALLLVGACGQASLARDAASPECPPQSMGLDVQPALLARGAPIDIRVEWTIDGQLEPPAVATLQVGEAGAIEVELPLVLEASEPERWAGTQQNPFGLGTPLGYVSVLARAAAAPGCDRSVTAVTSFYLE